MSYQPKVALVHDDFCQEGGAERLFEEIAKIYPDAPVYTALVNWQKLPSSIAQNRVHPSFIQKIPFAAKFYKALLPLYPIAFESIDLSGYDLVISSTTRFAKAVITKPKTIHVAYLNSIPRFLHDNDVLVQYLPAFIRFLIMPYMSWLRRLDIASAARVDHFIANSKNVQRKIKKIYKLESAIVYPFADTEFFAPQKPNTPISLKPNYYLIVSRLVKWKRIDIAIEACLDFKANLKIVGTGPDQKRLQNLSGV